MVPEALHVVIVLSAFIFLPAAGWLGPRGLPFRRYMLWRKLTRAMLAIGKEWTERTTGLFKYNGGSVQSSETAHEAGPGRALPRAPYSAAR